MNHNRARRMLSHYLDDELRADERSSLESHLAECMECAYELSELEQTVALLRSLPEADPPTDLAAGVMERIRAGEAEPSRWGRAFQRFADPGTGLALAAGVAGLVVFAALEPVRVPLPGSAANEARSVSPRAMPLAQVARGPQAESGVPVQTVSQGGTPARTAGFSKGLASQSRPMLGATRVPHVDAELKWLLFDPEAKVMELRQLSARERARLLRLLAAQAVETNEELEAFYRIRSVQQPGAVSMASVFEKQAAEARHQASMR